MEIPDALVVLQRLRAQQPHGSEPYRILDAAINHVIGFRPSSVGPEYDEEAI